MDYSSKIYHRLHSMIFIFEWIVNSTELWLGMRRIRDSRMQKTYGFVFHIVLIIQTVTVIRYAYIDSTAMLRVKVLIPKEFLCCFGFHSIRCDYKDLASARLENVTQTIARVLEGYDIRLRPDFGGRFGQPVWKCFASEFAFVMQIQCIHNDMQENECLHSL